MKITDQARDSLEQLLQEQNASGIRVFFAGISWGSPKLGLALDEPESDDEVIESNGIRVAIDPSIEIEAKESTLDFDEQANGFVLSGNERDCC